MYSYFSSGRTQQGFWRDLTRRPRQLLFRGSTSLPRMHADFRGFEESRSAKEDQRKFAFISGKEVTELLFRGCTQIFADVKNLYLRRSAEIRVYQRRRSSITSLPRMHADSRGCEKLISAKISVDPRLSAEKKLHNFSSADARRFSRI